ncbi:MAG: hypothetical protein GYB53_17910 [Rhodobacteraceae bacterium]|nr:hypothetical protein [Paracoccaceae bacterium]MBR9821922.1 hypothetical protein [Paracoccaceae bacterium]
MRQWVAAGQDHARFGHLTLRQIDLVLSGVLLGQERAARQRRGEIYSLGQLVLVAFNDPKKFPRPDAFLDGRRKRGSSGMEIRAYFQGRIAQTRARSAQRKS